MEKEINSRIVHKHDSFSNWQTANNFVPKQGEIIIYDAGDDCSYGRMKIGDGATIANDLPFYNEHIQNKRDTNDNFLVNDFVYPYGEMLIIDSPSGIKLKFGDGVSTYSQLPFYGNIYADKPIYNYTEITGLADQLEALQGKIDAIPVVMPGMIMMWGGSVADIPNGRVLCDGTNGTPDLCDKFVLGAGNTYSVGETGGESTHMLTTDEIPAHYHNLPHPSLINMENSSGFTVGQATNKEYMRINSIASTEESGGGQPHNNMPPYYALCYIMKI